ncbi:uncharacterized protein LOC117818303 isoform X4 [Notolabrus celidotus]|uniref:uncharacterized protein LOC117818303 isoform X4 n=1 Tax=Notolabrus celidotus TaxID=1203425 RepID=UPI00148F8946|nr:uncharacterized protein LOC117818303 isoform X4 [Notolabrus celidotus]
MNPEEDEAEREEGLRCPMGGVVQVERGIRGKAGSNDAEENAERLRKCAGVDKSGRERHGWGRKMRYSPQEASSTEQTSWQIYAAHERKPGAGARPVGDTTCRERSGWRSRRNTRQQQLDWIQWSHCPLQRR